MTETLSITMAQLDQKIGDLTGNAARILAARDQAPDSDLIILPELQLIGYPPEDLVMKPELARQAQAQLEQLALATADGDPALLVGSVFREGAALYNGMALLDRGEIATIRYKHELPNYGTFDEKRLFTPGPLPEPIDFRGARLGVPICEDIWFQPVCAHLKARGAQLLIVPNGSPWRQGKQQLRREVAQARVAETGLAMLYLDRFGGQDELVFDGASFVLSDRGELRHQLADWREELRTTIWRSADQNAPQNAPWRCDQGAIAPLSEPPEDSYRAMVTGLRAYVDSNGFPGVILGLSGGIDSALSAAVAVDALGPERVWCVMMSSKFTSQASLDDAAGCAKMLGCRLDNVPIGEAIGAFDALLAPLFAGQKRDSSEENIQARIRALILMALSNKFGYMLLTTGNKSEMAVGYATIYGDMAGGYSVLKDAYKLLVFELSEWRNHNRPQGVLGPDGPVMPHNIIVKPPSAELREDQRDDDSLPPYETLDPILQGLIEDELSVDQIAAQGFEREMVAKVEKLLYIAEYKRKQAPPGVQLTRKNFGRDRRYPITNKFRTS